uniref:Uncharacterized protein n=1 Tax=Romanomermis culicivorax TaxID=13658 RepID=A0A915JQA3_ROMCU
MKGDWLKLQLNSVKSLTDRSHILSMVLQPSNSMLCNSSLHFTLRYGEGKSDDSDEGSWWFDETILSMHTACAHNNYYW